MIGFTTPCLVKKNNNQIRKSLIKLGYKLCDCYKISYKPTIIECTPTDGKFHLSNGGVLDVWRDKIIDCGKNEILFLAIAALRDDSDYMQWFVLDKNVGSINYPESMLFKGSFIKCLTNKWGSVGEFTKDGWFDSSIWPAHKATIEELINYFNYE